MNLPNRNKPWFRSWYVYSLVVIVLVVITACTVVIFWSINQKPTLSPRPQTPLLVEAIKPNSGPAAGGTKINIYGSGFVPSRQYQVNIDRTFTFKGEIHDWFSLMLLQNDGKLVVASRLSRDGNTGDQVARFHSDGSVDRTFQANKYVDRRIVTGVVQADGKLLFGGNFTKYGNVPKNRLLRLNSDGSLDTTFNPSKDINYNVDLLLVQSDGKILAGTKLPPYEGGVDKRLLRLHPDGSVDRTFQVNLGTETIVRNLIVQPDDKLLLAGSLNTSENLWKSNLVRLHADGSLDTSFQPAFPANSYVHTIALQADGKILVVGRFPSPNYPKSPFLQLIRLHPNGSLDTTFNSSIGLDLSENVVLPHTDGKIWILGNAINYSSYFSLIEQESQNFAPLPPVFEPPRIVRLHANGAVDINFDTKNLSPNVLNNAILNPDGKILVQSFTLEALKEDSGNIISIVRLVLEPTGSSAAPLVLLNGQPCKDTEFLSDKQLTCSTPSSLAGSAKVEVVNGDGQIAVLPKGFSYTFSVDYVLPNVGPVSGGTPIILYGDGFVPFTEYTVEIDSNFKIGSFDGIINTMVQLPDGKILVGGSLDYYNSPRNLLRLHPDGSVDLTFNTNNAKINGSVNTIAVQPDGKILIGGTFTKYNQITRNSLARLNPDGSLDLTFDPGKGVNGYVETLLLQPDGKILVIGFFKKYNDVAVPKIVRLNPDGSLDPSFVVATDIASKLEVQTIALQPDGKILIAGDFVIPTDKGSVRPRIIRLNPDGSVDSTFTPGSGANDVITSIALQPDGKILIGGGFTQYNGVLRNRLARLQPNGSLDPTFDPGEGANRYVSFIGLQTDGKILIGGSFTSYDNVPRNSLARLHPNGALDTTFVPNSLSGWISHQFLLPNNQIFVSGYMAYNGIPIYGTLRLVETTTGEPVPFSITIGDQTCLELVFISWNRLRCTTPPGTIGPKTVTVTLKEDGQTVTLVNQFTYQPKSN